MTTDSWSYVIQMRTEIGKLRAAIKRYEAEIADANIQLPQLLALYADALAEHDRTVAMVKEDAP